MKLSVRWVCSPVAAALLKAARYRACASRTAANPAICETAGGLPPVQEKLVQCAYEYFFNGGAASSVIVASSAA